MIHSKRFKGRRCLGAAVMLSVLLAAGCKGGQEQPAPSTASETAPAVTAETTAGDTIANPMEEVKDVLAFEAIGVHMVLPTEAVDAKYFIINKEVADAEFTVDGVSYTFRASDTAEDFAGIFERFRDGAITETYDYGGQTMEIQIKTTDSGGRLSSWDWGSTKYTLYTASQVEDDIIRDLTMKLVELSQNEK